MDQPSSLHIMVVEDNDSLRDATIDFLTTQGHLVRGIACAEDLDNTPTNQLPDLYLIDVNLPDEDGLSLSKRIRNSQPYVGIILMTAHGQLNHRIQGYDAGADNYLTKPVDQNELAVCIENLGRRIKANLSVPQKGLVLSSQSLVLAGQTDEVSLTHAESLLLTALSRAAGQKLERWQALQLIDTKDKGLVPANLEMRISSLRKKLTACGAPKEAIRTFRGFGYALNCKVTIL